MIAQNKIEALRDLLAEPKQITIVSHINPDGDAIGSGVAWASTLINRGHSVRFIVPNNYPLFLEWMQEINRVHVYRIDPEGLNRFIEESELIFCLDFNQIQRLEELGEAIEKNKTAVKILIDHHLEPPQTFELMFSEIAASSTAFLTYQIMEGLGWIETIPYAVAEALYVGISTDTGNFTFGNLTPELFRAVAKLVEKGVDTPRLNIAIYNNYSANRMRLMGYVLNEKMEFMPAYRAAYMTLTKEEQLRYSFQPGDSEGFVNLPLSIKNISLTAFFIQTKDLVKVSLRSQGEIDVNQIARKYFNGGGHKNAAGGKCFDTIANAVEIFRKAVQTEFKPQ